MQSMRTKHEKKEVDMRNRLAWLVLCKNHEGWGELLKRTTLPLALTILAFGLSLFGSMPLGSVLHAQDRTEVTSEGDDRDDNSENDGHERILTIDHFVPHISSVPTNEGERVELFVRERFRRGRQHNRPVVLMVHTSSQSTVPAFDLRFEDYSWMAFLARAGFDVFAMDLTGYGFSPRPMMDDACNTSASDQDRNLIPNPLPERCAPNYPYRLSTSQSDWDEIDTVVDYLRELRAVDKVNLVAWSRGGRRAGGYTARHPEKVEKLFLMAPGVYTRLERSDPPNVLPEPGVPMSVERVGIFPGWDAQLKCEDQFTPAIRPVIASTTLEFDPLGGTWGEVGVRRAPVQTLWGWNQAFALQVAAPTLVIVGDLDDTQGIRDLFQDLGARQKVFVHVACASHFLPWENQHMILLRASEEWLREGTFTGQATGSFFVDVDGNVRQE